MKYSFYWLLASVLFFSGTAAFGQQSLASQKCGTSLANAILLQNHPEYAAKHQQLEKEAADWQQQSPNLRSQQFGDTIPVVFHVVYNTNVENISDAQILSQLAVLNEDFNRLNADAVNTPAAFLPVAGNPKLVFCLATLDPNGLPTSGITRTKTNRTGFSNTNENIKFDSLGGKSAWNPALYLNIWVVNLTGNILGYAQFPGGPLNTDGVVLKYSSTGRQPANPFPSVYNLGRTATHEIGHWLGLRHIWGEDQSSCTDSDLVDDTPNQLRNYEGCPKFPQTSSCTSSPPGEMFMNYMDYTTDACMNLFTQGQAARMQGFLNSARSTLLTSNVCSNKLNADFRANPEAIFPGQTTNFFYYSNGRRPTSFFWEFEGAVPETSTEINPRNIRYDKPGNFTVKLTVSEGGQTDSEIKIGYLKVTTQDLQLYPNPAGNFVSVGAPAGQKLKEVEIFNTAGKLVLKAANGQRAIDLDIRTLPNGLYLVRGSTFSGNFLSRRLLILRGN